MADLSEYPRFMCRAGTTEEAWGLKVDTTAAQSPEHEAELAADGWYRTPGEWVTDAKPVTAMPAEPKPKLSIKTEDAAK